MPVVMDAERITRALTRIAHEILEHNRGLADLALVGVRSRGVPIAHRIAADIKNITNAEIPVGALDITLYRDDLMGPSVGIQPLVRKTEIPFSIDGRTIVLVDDVLYTGRTTRAALDALIDFGRPKAIQLVVLVDRGHRELPIKADYVGKNVPTSRQQSVQVQPARARRRGRSAAGSEGVSMDATPTVTAAAPPLTALRSRHLLGIADLSPEEIVLVLDTAEAMKEVGQRAIKKVPTLRGRTVINLFFEPSTRTRTSFEIAEKRLSADTLNVAIASSSVIKGETLVDTAMNLEAMSPSMIVLRHASAGACHLLSRICKAAIVNAGDGMHEHPTQALLDAFTIRERKGRLNGLKVAIVGDLLHSRVLRSNVLLLTKLGAEVWVCAPATLIPPGLTQMGVHVTTQGRGGGRGRGRDHDAAHPAGADAGRLLPVAARVLHDLRHDRSARRAGQAGRDHHAPRPDQPRRGDRVGSGGRQGVGDPRPGGERCRRANGGALPAGRRDRE